MDRTIVVQLNPTPEQAHILTRTRQEHTFPGYLARPFEKSFFFGFSYRKLFFGADLSEQLSQVATTGCNRIIHHIQ
jgi:hypothetical protein